MLINEKKNTEMLRAKFGVDLINISENWQLALKILN